MTSPSPLATIDFLTHSKIKIAAGLAAIWPHILDIERWRDSQKLISVSGEPGRVGARFHAVSRDAPETPLFHVENVELVSEHRRTIRLEGLDGSFLGFATWELTPNGGETVVAYDVYCRGAMLPPGQSADDLLASAHRMMDEGLLRLKAIVEQGMAP